MSIPIIYFNSLLSTQSFVRDILSGFSVKVDKNSGLQDSALRDGIPKEILSSRTHNGFALYTLHQTAGYGQHQRQWQSPPGNIALSICLPKTHLCLSYEEKCDFSKLQFRVAKSTCDFIQKIIEKSGSECVHKPINDIIVNSRKIAGVLVQIVMQDDREFIVIGIGININCSPKIKIETNRVLAYQGSISVSDLLECKIHEEEVHFLVRDLVNHMCNTISHQ